MKQKLILIILLSGTTLLTQGELLMTVQTNANQIEIILSGSADISGLTPETRSGAAFFGESGLIFGNPPDPTDPLVGLQQYNAFALDLFPTEAFTSTPPPDSSGNWLHDPTLSYAVTPAPIGFFYGELYLPIGYVSGTELSGSLTLTNRTLADLGWVGGESFLLSWNGEQDSLIFNVIPEPTTLASILCVALGLYTFRCMKRHAREPRRGPPSSL